MIKSVEIERLRGIRLGELDELTPLVVLVGPNGCGKSTVLDALLIGADKVPAYGIARAVERRKTDIRAARWLIWQTDGHHETKITVRTGKAQKRQSRVLEVKIPQPSKQVVYCKNALSDGTEQVTEVWFDGNNEPTNIELIGPSHESPYVRLIETWRRATQSPLHHLYSQAAVFGRKAQAIELVKAVVPTMEGIEVLTDGDRPYLALTFANRAGPAALEGDGIQALVRICFELAAVGQGLVLMEEPEIHQHPGAIQQTTKAIVAAVERGIQVVLSTHSLEVIDSLVDNLGDDEEKLRMLSLFRLRLADGNLKSSRLSGPEIRLSRSQIADDLR